MFNIHNAKKIGWETFWVSVKFTWDSTLLLSWVPGTPIEIKPKSITVVFFIFSQILIQHSVFANDARLIWLNRLNCIIDTCVGWCTKHS